MTSPARHPPSPSRLASHAARLTWPALAVVAGCKGCQPEFPSDDADPDKTDTSPPPDTGDTAPIDTSADLASRCDRMEVEPNDTFDTTEEISMEEWWCGTFLGSGSLGDPEFFNFTPSETGWLSVEVEASVRNSEADAQFIFYNDEDSILIYDSMTNSDPRIVIPMSSVVQYNVAIAETGYLTGDEYTWALMASETKPPVVWTFSETDSNTSSADNNDDTSRANEFTIGETVFGTIDKTADKDWFHVVVPEGLQAVQFTVEAFGSGSPVDIQLKIYDVATGTYKKGCYHGVVDYDLDPDCELKVTEATEFNVQVDDEWDVASAFNWYTLTIVGVPAE